MFQLCNFKDRSAYLVQEKLLELGKCGLLPAYCCSVQQPNGLAVQAGLESLKGICADMKCQGILFYPKCCFVITYDEVLVKNLVKNKKITFYLCLHTVTDSLNDYP